MAALKLFLFGLILLVSSGTAVPQEATGKKRRDPMHEEELCRNFTIGHPRDMEFYSPQYPRNYPSEIACFRIITADIGYFVRIDFRDVFHLEPMSTALKCEYDFLEVRDGDQGYSPLIGKYCGTNFPPMITSSGRSLWMRFKSDSTIQYQGFKAVYSFIENPLDHMPDIGKCEFEAGDFQDFVGSINITDDRKEHSLTYDVPLDCVWTIRVEETYKLYIQFTDYELQHPNDCHLNYIQVYDEKTDEENLLKTFCGSVADSVTSRSNVVYIRFYAEKNAIDSQFSCVVTAMRSLGTGETCNEEEYDCDDATCIHPDLFCNDIRNCRFGWDEESCEDLEGAMAIDFSTPHNVAILVVLALIVLGMTGGAMWNLRRKMAEDRAELELAASRRSLAASSGVSINRTTVAVASEMEETEFRERPVTVRHNGGCHVPDVGYPVNARF